MANRDFNGGAPGEWETFYFHKVGAHWTISQGGYYLAVEPNGQVVLNRTATGPWEKFILDCFAARCTIKSWNNLYLNVDNLDLSNSLKLLATTYRSEWSQFDIWRDAPL